VLNALGDRLDPCRRAATTWSMSSAAAWFAAVSIALHRAGRGLIFRRIGFAAG